MTRTPIDPGAVTMFDHLPPFDAIMAAWTVPGPNVWWHHHMQQLVRDQMPLLGRALDRAAQQSPTTTPE